MIASTLMACEDTTCTAPDGSTQPVGATFSCDDGCNTCECMEDGSVAPITERDCS
jgi:hypothetical protein